ncbi:MAG TPA: chitobiase/beta-hexosaminidase C-terminal domain-containing protein [Terracidiphilus sp.]
MVVAVLLLAAPLNLNAETPEWGWAGGSRLANQAGVYGSLGTVAAGNLPGGRYGASNWRDKSGNLWLFGGVGSDGAASEGTLNDLWRFNPSTQSWTWMGGSKTVQRSGFGVYGVLGTPGVANLPGGRYGASSWSDDNGNLWLFGGEGYNSEGAEALLNDLWEFNPSTGEWAWMGGISAAQEAGVKAGVYGSLDIPNAQNMPGARSGAIDWTDSLGNLWLFGGEGADSGNAVGQLDDLWAFNPYNREWTWMGGSNTVAGAEKAVYGVLGTPSSRNLPGGRQEAVGWTDASGNFWLFGGGGIDSVGSKGELNDLWEFNPSTREWTWMSGSSTVPGDYLGQPGVYGTLGLSAAANVPGGRSWASSWRDSNGNLWLFGGMGYDSTGAYGALNDLWVFDPSTREWAWMGGSDICTAQPGVYGQLGTAAVGNLPGARYGSTGWSDSSGRLWLWGGMGYDSTGTLGELNDIWEQGKSTAQPSFSPVAGRFLTTQMVKIADATPGAAIYYTTNGKTPTTSSTLYKGAIMVSATETLQAIAVASGYSNSTVAEAAYTIGPHSVTPYYVESCCRSYTSTQPEESAETSPEATSTNPTSRALAAFSPVASMDPIKADAMMALEAVAVPSGSSKGLTAMAENGTNVSAASPSFSLTSGSCTSARTVEIADATPGAVIYYTINGEIPTTQSTRYSGAIRVTANETLQAIAVAGNTMRSAVATQTCAIDLPRGASD